jgi:hypothetical protein
VRDYWSNLRASALFWSVTLLSFRQPQNTAPNDKTENQQTWMLYKRFTSRKPVVSQIGETSKMPIVGQFSETS